MAQHLHFSGALHSAAYVEAERSLDTIASILAPACSIRVVLPNRPKVISGDAHRGSGVIAVQCIHRLGWTISFSRIFASTRRDSALVATPSD